MAWGNDMRDTDDVLQEQIKNEKLKFEQLEEQEEETGENFYDKKNEALDHLYSLLNS